MTRISPDDHLTAGAWAACGLNFQPQLKEQPRGKIKIIDLLCFMHMLCANQIQQSKRLRNKRPSDDFVLGLQRTVCS